MGCGTGLVGMELAKKGYINIDGIDASPGMLEYAREKKAYNNLYELQWNYICIYFLREIKNHIW